LSGNGTVNDQGAEQAERDSRGGGVAVHTPHY
jgi:hypothetical protein